MHKYKRIHTHWRFFSIDIIGHSEQICPKRCPKSTPHRTSLEWREYQQAILSRSVSPISPMEQKLWEKEGQEKILPLRNCWKCSAAGKWEQEKTHKQTNNREGKSTIFGEWKEYREVRIFKSQGQSSCLG